VVADLTQILTAIEGGDPAAAEQLLPLVYDELRGLAAERMAREGPGQTLQATALVHEAYLKLTRQQHSDPSAEDGVQQFQGRAHFFAAAAEAMRRILVDRARARKTGKRGGARARVDLTPDVLFTDAASDELVDLDDALQRLAQSDPLQAKVVTLRFFGGLTLEEAAAVLQISPRTADRLWAIARLSLFQAMRGDG
jgi:RNA polymerase sigma factor (TIGR02999 family)